jgi:histidine triad (HIT) family protein
MACIFCQIAKGEIPAEKVYESDEILAFLDIHPVNPGHTLVISKQHFENIQSVPEDILTEMIVATKFLSKAIMAGVKAEGFNLGLNNGKIAGQIVPHLHFHIMPRFKDDDLVLWQGKKYQEGEIEKVAQAIREQVPIPFLRIIYKINKYILILGAILFVLGILKFFKLPEIILKISRDEFFWTGILLIIYSLIIYLTQTRKK